LELIAGLVQLAYRQFREDAPSIELPLLLLLQQQRTHQAGDRGVVREDADDTGSLLERLNKEIKQVGAPDLASVLRGEHPGLTESRFTPFLRR